MYKHTFNSTKQPLHLAICQKNDSNKNNNNKLFKKFYFGKTNATKPNNKLNKLNSFPTIE